MGTHKDAGGGGGRKDTERRVLSPRRSSDRKRNDGSKRRGRFLTHVLKIRFEAPIWVRIQEQLLFLRTKFNFISPKRRSIV